MGAVVLRVHFTGEDLSRIRVAAAPDVLWETVLSATLLGTRRGPAVFDLWRSQAVARLRRLAPGQVGLVRYLAPPVGDFPDFLTPPEAAQGWEAGIEAVLGTPRSRLRREIPVLSGTSELARPLADGEASALVTLGQVLHDYHRAAVAPYWPRIRALIDADRALRARALLDHGAEGLLAGLRPTLRWHPPVLEADYPVRHDIHLQGRGLVLVPSVFCWRDPITLIDPDLPPVLVYPAEGRGPGWWTNPASSTRRRNLANLLGHTRAATLCVIEDGCSTSELARRVGVSPPTASQHATVLREAGLIMSIRQGNTMIHTVTPLGAALIQSTTRSYTHEAHID
jgi:DNA-binding transcriptional ArsR family regulator